MTAAEAMEKITAAMDDYFRDGREHKALTAIATVCGRYEGSK